MPNNSKLILNRSAEQLSDFDLLAFCIIEITKLSEYRCKLQADDCSGNTIAYISSWRINSGLSEWKQITT